MSEKYSCVVDAQGNYIEFVLQLHTKQEDGTEKWGVQYYTLKDGEWLADVLPPKMRQHMKDTGFIVPRIQPGEIVWEEGATPAEIAAWETVHPAPEVAEILPTVGERTGALEQALLTLLRGE